MWVLHAPEPLDSQRDHAGNDGLGVLGANINVPPSLLPFSPFFYLFVPPFLPFFPSFFPLF